MSAAPTLPALEIDTQPSRAEIAAFLSKDRLFCAYALADLDSANVSSARWWLARRDGVAVSAALVMRDLSFRPLFLAGDPDGSALLLRRAVREPRVIVGAPNEHRPAIEATYRLERLERMLRMVVDERSFVPADGSAHVVRLGAAHVDDLIDLYGLASRTYFTAQRLQREIYFGTYDGPLLVAVAGTHVRSHEFGLAAVGNVLTRNGYRNRGLARACSSAVTAACLAEHRDVVLNVREDNAPAVAVYLRLGYRVYRPFIEGPAYRRAAWERVVQHIFHAPAQEEEGDVGEDARA